MASTQEINLRKKLRQFCDETGILMILDEVLVGFGRCADFFAFQNMISSRYGLYEQRITGGYVPFELCIQVARYDFYENRVLSNGLTNYAHPLGLACMRTVIDTLMKLSFSNQKRH